MKISYLITCCNETTTLKSLLEKVGTLIKNSDDELVVLIDKNGKDNEKTKNILLDFASQMIFEMVTKKNVRIIENPLNNDYGSHKNFGVSRCSGNYIFQIDGDEMPEDSLLGENLHALLESNTECEAYAVPRINAWVGLTDEHAKKWGWSLDISPTYNRPRAAWPDYQWRIFKNDYPRISFKKKLHERIDGFKQYSILPADEGYAIYHDKTIERQIESNENYIKNFTKEENSGL